MRAIRNTAALLVLTAASFAQSPSIDWTKWWPQFQAAVAKHDPQAVAKMMKFPVDWELGKVKKIQTEADFIANYDRYMPADLVKAVATVTPTPDPGGMYTVDWKAHKDECTLFFRKDPKAGWVVDALSEGPPMKD